jgi:L-glyceraldehyde 3-phosphate reductase
VTSLVIGASSVDQLEQNVAALENLSLSAQELASIDQHLTTDATIDLWRQAREGTV